MPYQLWLPDVVSDIFRGERGFQVDVVKGWSRRGYSNFNPIGVMNHHTGKGSYSNLLNYMTVGSSIAPLCNIATSQPNNGVMRITICSAGKANHAGRGGLPWTGRNNGNATTIGIENQNNGREPWPDKQVYGIRLLSAGLLEYLDVELERLVDHKTYAPIRKVDRYSVDVEQERKAVAAIMRGADEGDDEDMKRGDSGPNVERWQKNLEFVIPNTQYAHEPDGNFGESTEKWTMKFQQAWGIPDDGVVDTWTMAMMARTIHEIREHGKPTLPW